MSFTPLLLHWYERHGRTLPWRETHDAYRVWISEIILQQTQVAQGLDYYRRFVERFPSVDVLAAATEDEVFGLWQGLGYYSRARNLHAAAKAVVASGGHFPTDHDAVRALPGIGPYTAAAICAFAYNQPFAAVDGNAYRVLTRVFDIPTPIDTPAGRREVQALADQLIDRRRPADWNAALMDFGATHCTPRQPRCHECPLSDICLSRAAATVTDRPVKSRRVAVAERFFVYVFLRRDGLIYLCRRGSGDIWAGLYQPLLLEFDHRPSDAETLQAIIDNIGTKELKIKTLEKGIKHLLTHRRLYIDAYAVALNGPFEREGFVAVKADEIDAYAVPRPVERLLERVLE